MEDFSIAIKFNSESTFHFSVVTVVTCGLWGDSSPPISQDSHLNPESQLASSIRRSSNCASCNSSGQAIEKQQVDIDDIEKNPVKAHQFSPTNDPCTKSKCNPALCWSSVGPVMLPFLLLRALPFQITTQCYSLTFSPLQYSLLRISTYLHLFTIEGLWRNAIWILASLGAWWPIGLATTGLFL